VGGVDGAGVFVLAGSVGGGLTGAVTVTIGVGCSAADGDVDVGVDAQAVTKTTTRMSTMM
jgi:hypothetical protein